MAKAFMQNDSAMILKDLKASAIQYSAACGIHKITVEELAEQVGISKGTFYKFYPHQ